MAISHLIVVADGSGGEGIVTVVILVLGGLYWLFQKLAEARNQEGPSSPARTDKDKSYAADEDEVQRFLETLGQRPPRPQPQQPPPQPQPTEQPGRPPGRPPAPPQPVTHLKQEPAARIVHSTHRAPTAPPAEEYRFAAEKQAAAPVRRGGPAPQPKPSPAEPPLQPARARSAEKRLEFPQLSALQRAVVLSEVLQRKRGR